MSSLRGASYVTPTRNDMAVMMVVFNPGRSVRIIQNYLYVWNLMKTAGIPVFGAELLFPWQKRGLLADCNKTLTVRSDSVMFHKEKLFARLEKEVPMSFTKLCCIDCDVVFENAAWYDAVSEALDVSLVVQPYAECRWMAADMRTAVTTKPSAAVNIAAIRERHQSGVSDRFNGHPGFAMAMRREVPSFTWAVVGGGDAVFFRAVNGLTEEFANPRMSELMMPVWREYSADMATDMSHVTGAIWHLWHGPLRCRQYYDRYVKFTEAVPATVTDIRELLVENEDGVWCWRDDVKVELNRMMLHYFTARDDDLI
jgi:hypothetical protein